MHDTVKQQNDGLVTDAEGLFYCNNGRGDCVCKENGEDRRGGGRMNTYSYKTILWKEDHLICHSVFFSGDLSYSVSNGTESCYCSRNNLANYEIITLSWCGNKRTEWWNFSRTARHWIHSHTPISWRNKREAVFLYVPVELGPNFAKKGCVTKAKEYQLRIYWLTVYQEQLGFIARFWPRLVSPAIWGSLTLIPFFSNIGLHCWQSLVHFSCYLPWHQATPEGKMQSLLWPCHCLWSYQMHAILTSHYQCLITINIAFPSLWYCPENQSQYPWLNAKI